LSVVLLVFILCHDFVMHCNFRLSAFKNIVVVMSLRSFLQYACLYVAITFHHCLADVMQFCYFQTVNKLITNGEMRDTKNENHMTAPRQW